MCLCNRGVTRRVKHNRHLIKEVKYLLMQARYEKQQAELAQDFYDNAHFGECRGFALTHRVKAKEARVNARKLLIEIELAWQEAHAQFARIIPPSALLLGGRWFRNWEAYREVFGTSSDNLVDTWQ